MKNINLESVIVATVVLFSAAQEASYASSDQMMRSKPLVIASMLTQIGADGKILEKQELTSSLERVLLVFWSTTCSSCKKHITGDWEEIHNRTDIDVLGVSLENDADRVRDFVVDRNVKIPVYVEPNRELRKKYKVFAPPHWVLLRRSSDGMKWVEAGSGSGFETSTVLMQIDKGK